MSPELKLELKGIEKLSRDERYAEAREQLIALSTINPEEPAVWLMLGSAAFQLDDHVTSIPAFRKVLELRPHNHKASLGLFHSLWGAELKDQALEEIKRFLSSANPEVDSEVMNEYMGIIREINEKW